MNIWRKNIPGKGHCVQRPWGRWVTGIFTEELEQSEWGTQGQRRDQKFNNGVNLIPSEMRSHWGRGGWGDKIWHILKGVDNKLLGIILAYSTKVKYQWLKHMKAYFSITKSTSEVGSPRCHASMTSESRVSSILLFPHSVFWPHQGACGLLVPVPLQWNHRFLTTAPPGNSLFFHS